MFEGPEKKFQHHIAEYFIHEHRYAVLEQDEIIDAEYYFAEDHLIAFFKATQKETFELNYNNPSLWPGQHFSDNSRIIYSLFL